MRVRSIAVDLSILVVFAAACGWMAWIGYQGWGLDDAHYVLAAQRWAESPPYVGKTHWELRLGFVLPLAASLRLFGMNEFALVAVPAMFYAGLILSTYGFATKLFGREYGLFAGLVMASVPLIAAWGTTPRVAIAEGFYLLLSFWFLITAILRDSRIALWTFASGLCFGLAWLSRESAIGFAVALLVLFAVGRPLARRHYLWIGLGAALVMLAEMGFYASTTGNPFYRLYLDLNHGVITRAGGEGEAVDSLLARAVITGVKTDDASAVMSRVEAGGSLGGNGTSATDERHSPNPAEEGVRIGGDAYGANAVWSAAKRFVDRLDQQFDPAKIERQPPVSLMPINNWIDPYALFFIEPYYGIVFWLLFPAVAFLLMARQAPNVKRFVVLGLLVSASILVADLYLLYLRPLPRYFVIVAAIGSILVGFFLAALWRRERRTLTLMLLSMIVISSIILMDARRGLGLHNERRMIAFAGEISAPLVTDATSVKMSSFFVDAGLYPGAASGCPLPGAVYFFNSERPPERVGVEAVSRALILGTGRPIYEYRSREKILGMLLRLSGLAKFLPGDAVQRLSFPYGVGVAFDIGWVDVCPVLEVRDGSNISVRAAREGDVRE